MKSSVFKVIGAETIKEWLEAHLSELPELTKKIYLKHSAGDTNNPDSYFLRFPVDTKNRIIALPCSIEDQEPICGIKWISSFPDNIYTGLERASAVIIVNDRITGYPKALLEGSLISIARTAASATLGALYLHPTQKIVRNLSVVGCGPIASATVRQMLASGFAIDKLTAIDLDKVRAEKFLSQFEASISQRVVGRDISELKNSDLILFATSAGSPYANEVELFSHNPTVLHISLRDIGLEVIAESQNFSDDISHCLKAQTSLHLSVEKYQSQHFIAGTIADLVNNEININLKKPRIYSPFGMGVLDLAFAREILKDKDSLNQFIVEKFLPLVCEE